MKFEDILFLMETGGTMVAIASSNPLLAASVTAGVRMVQIGHDSYVSGRKRGEWSPEQQKHFDEVVMPSITAQEHWKVK